jgi:hypothetical protein
MDDQDQPKNEPVVAPPIVVPVPPKRVVWIKCRGHVSCEGNQSEVVSERPNNPMTQDGGFEPNAGGRAVRYRCLTCRRTFHINS